MSPIRPAVGFVHLTPPKPHDVRGVHCPFCHHDFEISRRAMVVRCPRCTSPMRFEDMTVRHHKSGEVDTMGHVQISSASAMTGQIVCGQLTNAGRFDGSALVHGQVLLLSNSLTTGHITGQSLRVPFGATLRAKAFITPETGCESLPAVPGQATQLKR